MHGFSRWMMMTVSFAALADGAGAAAPSRLQVTVEGIQPNQPIPARYALCKATADGKSTQGENERPAISWSGAPEGTKSFAVIVSDTDVPADFSKAGKEGEVIAANAMRRPHFYHWALVDIPAGVTSIPGGKGPVSVGTAAKSDMTGYVSDPAIYAGPCPPWNDARLHHYHFAVYALDSTTLSTTPPENAAQAMAALEGNPHVLARGEVTGTYTLNAHLRK